MISTSTKKLRVAITEDARDRNEYIKSNNSISLILMNQYQLKSINISKPTGCPFDSIIFDKDEFQRSNYLHGPFTLDACASPFDTKCPNYCSIDKPFETTDIRRHNIFFNPPFDEKVLPMLKHFKSTTQKTPFTTRAIIILKYI